MDIVRKATDDCNVDQILRLTLVSTTWQSFIISQPSLWTKIVLKNEHDALSKVFTQIILSRDLPLTIEIWNMKMHSKTIKEQRHRIRDLRVTLDLPILDRPQSRSDEIFELTKYIEGYKPKVYG